MTSKEIELSKTDAVDALQQLYSAVGDLNNNDDVCRAMKQSGASQAIWPAMQLAGCVTERLHRERVSGSLKPAAPKSAEPESPEIPVEREAGSFPAPFAHRIYPWGKKGFTAYVRVFRPYSKALLAGEPNAPTYGPPQIKYTGGGNGFSVAEAERLMAAFQIATSIAGRIAAMNDPSELD